MLATLRLLLIEDYPIDQMAFEDYVHVANLPYAYHMAASVAEAQQILSEQEFDIIVADYALTDGTALDILSIANGSPVIVITSTGNEDIAVRAMKAGAYDYLVKDSGGQYLHKLPSAIDSVLERRQAERLAEEHTAALAASEERQRLARELHDSLSQTLFSIHAIGRALSDRVNSNTAHPLVDEINVLSTTALAEMRVVLTELRPSQLEEGNLDRLLRTLITARQVHTQTQLELHFEVQGELPLDVKVCAYRIAQEALNNIIKHAKASHGVFDGYCGTDRIWLRVRDDGVGFDVQANTNAGNGLSIMRERAAALGAVVSIQSSRGQGTSVEFDWVQTR
jgi:signal transduction histidine kinase